VTATTDLEDATGNDIILNAFGLGETVDAWGPSTSNGVTQARRIRKR